jgi:mono/diheme cytochrome c family protein
MKRQILKILAGALALGMALGTNALAGPAPRMPYIFETYCFPCHKERVQAGPVGILDMRSKAGNPLHEQFIRSNVRFGYNAMPAFRPSEVSTKDLDGIVVYLKDLAAYRKAHAGYQPAPAQQGGSKK